MRRTVRTTEDFWASLDHALPTGREPSWHAFAAHDLPGAIERLATDWDTLPLLIPGRTEYRLLVGAARTVYAYAIEAQLGPDDAVELTMITVDLHGPEAAS